MPRNDLILVNFTSQAVMDHLHKMNNTYLALKDLEGADLYECLCQMERDYILYGSENFAKTVHQLNPLIYQNEVTRIAPNVLNKFAVCDRMICPFCFVNLPPANAYQLHIKNETSFCISCREVITYDALVLGTFVANFNRRCYPLLSATFNDIYLNFTKSISTWKTFSAYLLQVAKADRVIPTLSRYNQRPHALKMRSDARSQIAALRKNLSFLSMDLVKGMYRQLSFVNKICSNFDYWNSRDVLNASVARYEKFIHLMKFHRRKTLVPTLDIDLVWHTHQTDPANYCQYTAAVLGRVLNHDDNIGSGDLGKGYARTFIFWSQMYSEPYAASKPSFYHWQKSHMIASILLPPFGIYRRIVWNKHSATERKFGSEVVPAVAVGVPVMESVADPNNLLSRNLSAATPIRSGGPYFFGFGSFGGGDSAGSCGGAGCAAGSCGYSGCGGEYISSD